MTRRHTDAGAGRLGRRGSWRQTVGPPGSLLTLLYKMVRPNQAPDILSPMSSHFISFRHSFLFFIENLVRLIVRKIPVQLLFIAHRVYLTLLEVESFTLED